MARRTTRTSEPPADGRIVDVDVSDEMRGSFLEYAYSVIYARALPDARDGLKPVQRRILFQMAQMGLRPDRGHVKSARVVGDVMGRLHPHGDSAIYDALVRMAQPFSLRLPMVDGHGNFGSLDDGPAAMRYTEARLATPAMDMTAGLDEDVVDFGPNYDGRETEPLVLPAAIPNLLVNGASGIAVGMATNLVPAQRRRGAQRRPPPAATSPMRTLSEIMTFIPGPGLPRRRRHHRSRRRPRRLRDRSRQLPRPRPHPRGADHAAPARHRRHRAAVQRRARARHRPHQGRGAVEEAAGHLRRRRPDRRRQRPEPRHRDQERLPSRGGARAPVQAHADGGHRQHQRGGPRRRAAADDGPAADAARLARPPARGRAPPERLPAHQGARPGCISSRACSSPSSTSTRSSS